MPETVLRGAIVGSATADVRLADGTIVTVTAGHEAGRDEDGKHVDLDGYVLLPSPVEPHAHLDKAFLADVVANPTGDLAGAIAAMQSIAERFDVGATTARAVRAIEMFAANGCTAIRTHVDVTAVSRLGPLEAVLAAREVTRGIVDIEIVALCGFPVTGPRGAEQRALLAEAMAMGADLVGGCPHLDEDDPVTATDVLLGMASDRDVGVDLHTDETLDPDIDCLADLARAVLDGFEHPVTASHCVSLSMKPPARQAEIAERLAAAGIGVVALPQTNLGLQGRALRHAVPRAITPVRTLLDAGVAVAAGQDNVQDPFNPLGRGCPLDTAALMVAAAHLSPQEAYATVSDGARQVLGLEPVAVAAGSPADLLAVRAGSLREAIAMAPNDRLIWRNGERSPPPGATA